VKHNIELKNDPETEVSRDHALNAAQFSRLQKATQKAVSPITARFADHAMKKLRMEETIACYAADT